MTPSEPHVRLRGITKSFGANTVLHDVDLDLGRGLVHALVGENGAGKSTLGKLVAGVHAPDGGSLWVDGREVRYASPRDALDDGITVIAQELMLVPERSVLENVFLGSEVTRAGFVRRRLPMARYRELCESIGFDLPPQTRVGSLRLADQQKVEILRALAREARLIVMDEPTAALTVDQAARLLDVIRQLRARGTTVVFVSHFLEQVLAVADTVTVLRDGAMVHHGDAVGETSEMLVTRMLGRPMETAFPPRTARPDEAPVLLRVDRLRREGAVRDVSLEVRAGEIVGIAGLVGSGRTELLRTIFGAEPADSGEISVRGVPVRIRSPRQAVRAGLAMISESRKDDGLHMTASIRRNIALPHIAGVAHSGFVTGAMEQRAAESIAERVGVRGASLGAPVGVLSGGNQQKTMFAKWLLRRPVVLMIDEPTRGVDVGSKRRIYDLICSLAAEGMGVLVVSSEVEEILGLAHRVLVMRGGSVVAEFDADTIDEERLLQAAFGTEALA